MAPVFASADMAALVAAYQPPTPSNDRPSLVLGRRKSDEYLLDSRRIIKQLRSLLETSSSRIALSDLSSRLDIDQMDWLLACYEDALFYSRDGRYLLPLPEYTKVKEDALGDSALTTIDAASFAARNDLSKSTLKSLLDDPSASRKLHWWDDESTKASHIYSDTLAHAVNEYLTSLVTSAYADAGYVEGVDLCSRFPNVPAELLLQLAKTFAARTPDAPPPGEWQVLRGRAVFIPESHVQDLESKKEAACQAQIEHGLESLSQRGFCKVDDTDIVNLIRKQYMSGNHEQTAENALFEFVPENEAAATSKHTYLVRSKELREALHTLHIAAPQETARVWHARDGSENNTKLIAGVFTSLIEETHRELQRALLQSSAHRPEIEKTVVAALEKHTVQDAAAFEKVMIDRLVIPVQLYTQGVANTTDDTLKQHLDEFVGDSFRRDVLPALTSTLQEHRLLLDKPRRKDYDKMSESVSQAKVLPDVQAAATKLSRKQKLKQPSEDELIRAKRTTLEQKARQLRNKKIARGSDILQNLIWILLAEKMEGLYMSSGKDTTRMIKLYGTIASTDEKEGHVASKLAEWRDALKAGKEDQGMLDEMRNLAIESVERWCDAHKAEALSEEV